MKPIICDPDQPFLSFGFTLEGATHHSETAVFKFPVFESSGGVAVPFEDVIFFPVLFSAIRPICSARVILDQELHNDDFLIDPPIALDHSRVMIEPPVKRSLGFAPEL